MLLVSILLLRVETKEHKEFLVLTVATEHNDALDRFLRSAKLNGFDVDVIGLGVSWKGGDVAHTVGGGQKVNMLKYEVGKYRNREDMTILFVDSYDVLFLRDKSHLLAAYEELGGGVIFSAEPYCWPKESLANDYPEVGLGEKRFLNSGGFLGPASSIYKLVTDHTILDTDDDQLYYTELFLNPELRKQLNMKLDTRSTIFQNFHGTLDELELEFTEETGVLHNKITGTRPIIAHGNGPIKVQFNSWSNYLVHSWTPERECQHCAENNIPVDNPEQLPVIQMSIIVAYPTPFLDLFFERIAALSYPKNRIHLTGYISKSAEFQRHHAEQFNRTYGSLYRSNLWFDAEQTTDELSARLRSFAYCLATEDCEFLFSVDGIAQLTEPNVIQQLVQLNRSIVAPMVTRRGKLWSNFWGAISSNGYYERSDDYIQIAQRERKGLWNVPFVSNIYLMSRAALQRLSVNPVTDTDEVQMAIAERAREKNIFMWVDNRYLAGYLVYPDTYTTTHKHNDLWQVFDNPEDWEEQYIQTDYFKLLDLKVKMQDIEQPCPDVFWFPMLTEKFCQQLIEEMEFYGNWSDGSNTDSRLEGGYENVPTRDIHMRQVDWEDHWIHVQRKYVHPVQMKVYEGYDDKPWARMNFVVRYRPDEQPSLRPHHDASSYSLNIALNKAGIDYQGGGTRFVRYNCSITKSRVGWVVMSPGRVTHLHEGLETTAGTRYIFITFVNP